MPLRLKGILVTLVILALLFPAWYLNRWLQKIVQPRRSFAQFLLYMLLCFAMVFVYTFLVTAVVLRLFPASR